MPVREMPSALPMQTRRAPIGAGAIDTETRTVSVVFSTGAAVRRRRWEGWDTVPFDEVLEVSERAINMDRLNAGAPALDSHSAWSSYSQVGVVERAWVEGGEARASIRFPKAGIDEAADRMFGLIVDGIVRNVSVGYVIDQARVIEAEKKGDIEQRIVERWTPMEISFVTIPADAGAQVRSAAGRESDRATYPTIINRAAAPTPEESGMTDENTRSAAVESAQSQAPAAPAAADAIRAERERCAAITDIGTRAALPAADVAAALADGTSVDAFRARAFDALAGRQQTASHAVVQRDETETRRAAMEEAIVRQMNPAAMAGEWSGAAAQYRGLNLVSLAEIRLGERRSGDSFAAREDILRRAMHTTSDFPILLENAMNRSVAARYALAQPTYREFSVRQDFNDFRPHISVTAGDFPALKKMSEGGNITFGTIGEKKEQVALATYSGGVSISRQVLVNDTLGALDAVLASYGQTVAQIEEVTAYAVLAENSADGPTLLEGAAAMFTTGRTNKAGTATAINEAGVSAGRAAMRAYKSVDGNTLLYNAPAIILCSPTKETEAEKFVSTVVAAQTANVNPFANKLRVVVGAQLTGNRWWLFCEPSVRSNFRWGLLSGQSAPRVRMDEPFGTDGMGMTVVHDFGFGGIDWRAGYANAGA